MKPPHHLGEGVGVVMKQAVVEYVIDAKTVVLKITVENIGCAYDVTLCEKR